MKKLLGVLGGLGPIASAEFLKTIYELNVAGLEQEMPACILYSDPKFPDRTAAIAGYSDEILINLLIEILEKLSQLGAEKIVIACTTIHYFLPRIPAQLSAKVISLIDLVIQEVFQSKKQHLMLSTPAARDAGIFQQHPEWSLVEQYIKFPDDEDQNVLHQFIYQIKQNCNLAPIAFYLEKLLFKYQVDSLIIGCTELHLVTKYLARSEFKGRQFAVVDPLITLAKNIHQLMDE